ncbi:MAG TPA: alpha/beta hydrolase [Planctomycetota bacterium]|nr:alpha/beta hydrolase [Planctomycetota bacterium]
MIKAATIHLAILLGTALLRAGAPLTAAESILLWPESAPGAKGNAPADKPAITVHLPAPEKANGAAIVICPGGGYGALMMSYEGHDVAKWLNEHGVAGIVLQYRIHPYQHPAPLLDAKRALRITRAHAAEWKIDPKRIGVMGFSAGGHVASTLGTHFDAGDATATDPIERVDCRPDFMVLVYPVITMNEKTHAGSRENLLGKNPTAVEMDFLSNEKQVTANTPPAFLVHSKLDKAVSVENSAVFHAALKAHGVTSEFLELPTGDHGLGCGKGELWAEWEAKCLEWMKTSKIIK